MRSAKYKICMRCGMIGERRRPAFSAKKIDWVYIFKNLTTDQKVTREQILLKSF